MEPPNKDEQLNHVAELASRSTSLLKDYHRATQNYASENARLQLLLEMRNADLSQLRNDHAELQDRYAEMKAACQCGNLEQAQTSRRLLSRSDSARVIEHVGRSRISELADEEDEQGEESEPDLTMQAAIMASLKTKDPVDRSPNGTEKSFNSDDGAGFPHRDQLSPHGRPYSDDPMSPPAPNHEEDEDMFAPDRPEEEGELLPEDDSDDDGARASSRRMLLSHESDDGMMHGSDQLAGEGEPLPEEDSDDDGARASSERRSIPDESDDENNSVKIHAPYKDDSGSEYNPDNEEVDEEDAPRDRKVSRSSQNNKSRRAPKWASLPNRSALDAAGASVEEDSDPAEPQADKAASPSRTDTIDITSDLGSDELPRPFLPVSKARVGSQQVQAAPPADTDVPDGTQPKTKTRPQSKPTRAAPGTTLSSVYDTVPTSSVRAITRTAKSTDDNVSGTVQPDDQGVASSHSNKQTQIGRKLLSSPSQPQNQIKSTKQPAAPAFLASLQSVPAKPRLPAKASTGGKLDLKSFVKNSGSQPGQTSASKRKRAEADDTKKTAAGVEVPPNKKKAVSLKQQLKARKEDDAI